MILLGLSGSHKAGLAGAAGIFIVFAVLSALVLPRWWPQFPGKGRGAFIALTALLFVGMLAAVEIFGKEKAEAAAAGEATTTAPTTTQAAPTTAPATTAETTTQSATTAPPATTAAKTEPAAPQAIKVSETEFKIALPQTTLKAGKVEFDLANEGKIGHDLTVNGPGVANKKTSVIQGGQTATLDVTLKPGTYDLYCSVPGHKAAGMDLKVTVS